MFPHSVSTSWDFSTHNSSTYVNTWTPTLNTCTLYKNYGSDTAHEFNGNNLNLVEKLTKKVTYLPTVMAIWKGKKLILVGI